MIIRKWGMMFWETGGYSLDDSTKTDEKNADLMRKIQYGETSKKNKGSTVGPANGRSMLVNDNAEKP